jgi:hypothetical protein
VKSDAALSSFYTFYDVFSFLSKNKHFLLTLGKLKSISREILTFLSHPTQISSQHLNPARGRIGKIRLALLRTVQRVSVRMKSRAPLKFNIY